MTIVRPDPRGRDRDADPLASAVWIRPYRDADAGDVRALVADVLAEFDLALDPDGVDADLADVEASYRVGGGEFWVVEDATGRVVGSGGLWPDPDDPGRSEVRKMYLAPDVRGRGLGKRLLEAALEAARRSGRTRVELETNHAMTAAMALYRRYGFREVGGAACAARCDRRFALDLASDEASRP